jgi:hypothetical protein
MEESLASEEDHEDVINDNNSNNDHASEMQTPEDSDNEQRQTAENKKQPSDGGKGSTELRRVLSGAHNLSDSDHQTLVDTLPALLDMWTTCAKLCMNSETFRACYRNSPCLYIVQETLVLALSVLTDGVPTPGSDARSTCPHLRPRAKVSSEHEDVSPSDTHEQKLAGDEKRWSEFVQHRQPTLACHLSRVSLIEAVMIVCFACQTIQPLQQVCCFILIFSFGFSASKICTYIQ